MKKPFALVMAGALALAAALPVTAEASLPPSDSQGHELPSLAPMLKQTVPAVVNVFTRSRVPVEQNPLFADPFFRRFFNVPDQPQERIQQALGSGVIIDAKKGYIITNHHVVDQAQEIEVNLNDGRTLKAKLIGSDPETDVAVIQVKPDHLSALPLADSDKLNVGDFVVAIGNPFGLGQTVTSGIVSALGRSGLGIEGLEDFIQTDASINPGNSGGALVNLRGQLVGINTAILSKSGGNVGIGFAIPINMVREVMNQLIQHGSVQRGRLGVEAQDLTPELAQAFKLDNTRGAVITRVDPKSPAARAGLLPGDIVQEVNGRPVRDGSDLRTTIGLVRVGQKVELHLLRDGQQMDVKVVVEKPELVNVKGEELNPHLAGAVLQNATDGDNHAVQVVNIAPGSPAWNAGLRKGDVIAQANRHPVKNLNDLASAVKGSQALLLNIQRRGGALFVIIR